MEEQMSLFPEAEDRRPPQSVTWNGWHGCNPCSSGCLHCYMMRRDKEYGKDPTKVHKTANFNLPVRRYRSGEYKGLYKIPSGSTISHALLRTSSIRQPTNGGQKPGP